MSKHNRNRANQQASLTPPPPHKMVTSDIPVGGKPQQVRTERPEADVITWNSESHEVPPDNNGEVVGAPVPHPKDPDRDARIRALLDGDDDIPSTEQAIKAVEVAADEARGGDAEVEAEEATEGDEAETAEEADGETTEDGEEPAVIKAKSITPEKPKVDRKSIFANLEAERAKRKLEAQLKDANEKANAAEARAKVLEDTSKSKSIARIARERGMTNEQVMEEMILKGDDAEEDAAKPATPAVDPEKEAMARRLEALERDRRAEIDQRANAVVAAVIGPLDLPLVKATKRIPWPKDDGTVVFRGKEELILAIAEQRWIDEGRPEHINRIDYLGPAAETLEEHLKEENGDMLAAHAARLGKVAKDDAPVIAKTNGTAKVPALGKRMTGGGGTPAPGNGLSMDPDVRRLQIKEKFGFK